eukprot:1627677-Amphidinium_carterae.3
MSTRGCHVPYSSGMQSKTQLDLAAVSDMAVLKGPSTSETSAVRSVAVQEAPNRVISRNRIRLHIVRLQQSQS